MKVIPLPEDRAQQEHRARSLKAIAKGYNVCLLGLSIAAVVCLVATLVVVIVLETGDPSAAQETLYYILAGSFAGGAVLFGKLAQEATRTHSDFVERICGEECFFVGEGTIAGFRKDGLSIFSLEDKQRAPIEIPYKDVKLYSVCTRPRPEERGKWSVVIEVPAKYVMKRGDSPRALIETDGKERLYRTIEQRGLTLMGEQPPRGDEKRENVRFKPQAKFLLPDAQKRRRSLLFAGLGVLLIVAGALIAVFWQDFMLVGLILAVFGVFLAVRSLIGFSRAKGVLAFYDEGIYWRESGRAEADRFFLKWSELVSVKMETVAEKRYIAAVCAYGSYHIPDVAGGYEYLKGSRPDLCK